MLVAVLSNIGSEMLFSLYILTIYFRISFTERILKRLQLFNKSELEIITDFTEDSIFGDYT